VRICFLFITILGNSNEKNSWFLACDLIDNGVAVIFGPSSKAASGKWQGQIERTQAK